MNPEFYNPLHAPRTLVDRCIVSCATEPAYYERLHATRLYCHRWAPEAWQLMYYGYPDGCPTQAEHQYAFKIHALRRPVAAGFRTILWMDTAFQPVSSMQPLWDEIETNGWYVPAPEVGRPFLAGLVERNKHVIISVPNGPMPQEPVYGNEHERHLWTFEGLEEFERFEGMKVLYQGLCTVVSIPGKAK